ASLFPTPVMPTFTGGSNWLQVDVSRLPRTDQVLVGQAAMTSGMAGSPVGDMKTVTYYMAAGANMPQILSTQTADGSRGKGLLRREMLRASHAAASATTSSTSTNNTLPEPLAPEVVGVTFEYSNGSNYQLTWDSRQQFGLPKAVRISVTFLAGKMDPT